jgi:hypothetical protein
MKYLLLFLFLFIGCQTSPTAYEQKEFAGTWYMQGDCEWVIETGADYLILKDVKYIGNYTETTFDGEISKEYNLDIIKLHIELIGKNNISGYYSNTNKPNLYFDGVRLR